METNYKLKYIVVTPFFPSPKRWQGAYVLDQVKAIMRHSAYEVIVFKTHTLDDNEQDYEIEGVHVNCIRPLLMPSYILNGATDGLVGRLFVKKLQSMNICIQDIAFVHCHTCNHSAFGFGVRNKNANTKVLIQFHDPDPFTLRNGKFANQLWNRKFRANRSWNAMEKADLLISISKPVRDALLSFPHPRKYEVFASGVDMYKGIEKMNSLTNRNIYILNNGVDLSIFKPLSNCKNSKIFHIGCIANFQDWKDQETIVHSLSILHKKGLNDIRMSFIGSGPTKKHIISLIEDLGLGEYTECISEVAHDKLPEFYNSLDLFVLPSRFEGFGCVYTESYACGVPFICCENQGASECISPDESSLWLAKDHNPEHLAQLIERQYYERNTQHLIKEYDIDKLIPAFLTYLTTFFG